jgi:hypothetical protein
MAITYAQITDAIESRLGVAIGLARSQSYDELTDGMTDTPTLQVYWQRDVTDPQGTTHQTAFGTGVQQVEVVFHADLFARQRSHIGDDMAVLYGMAQAVRETLEAETSSPYFGLDGIKAFRWTAERVTFEYGDPSLPYIGARFVIIVRVF